MKKGTYYYFMLLLIFGMISCNPCNKMDCGNGTCDDGQCACNTGYEQDGNGKCSVEERTKFLGNWTGVVYEDTGLMGTLTIGCTLTISPTSSIQKIKMETDLFKDCNVGFNYPFTATISGGSIKYIEPIIDDGCDGHTYTTTFSNLNISVNGEVMNFNVTANKASDGMPFGSFVITGTLYK